MVIVDSPFTIGGDVPPLVVGFTRQPTADLVSYLASSRARCRPIATRLGHNLSVSSLVSKRSVRRFFVFEACNKKERGGGRERERSGGKKKGKWTNNDFPFEILIFRLSD